MLPAIVTCKPLLALRGEIEDARRLGVFVVSSEGIADALTRVPFLSDADQMFTDAWEQTQAFADHMDPLASHQ